MVVSGGWLGGWGTRTDDLEGLESRDQLVLYILGGVGVVVGAESVFDEGCFELGWVQGFELGLRKALVVVEDGDLDWYHCVGV